MGGWVGFYLDVFEVALVGMAEATNQPVQAGGREDIIGKKGKEEGVEERWYCHGGGLGPRRRRRRQEEEIGVGIGVLCSWFWGGERDESAWMDGKARGKQAGVCCRCRGEGVRRSERWLWLVGWRRGIDLWPLLLN